ncbi:LPS export ABC transporter periplasmic protein LptC [Rickettsiaceae bacterium]|nr:LPS export ABC transporter periplasmic protein LptC [Rickettsiaceae bacterium]
MGDFTQYRKRIKLLKYALLAASLVIFSLVLFFLYSKNSSPEDVSPIKKRNKSSKEYSLNINNSVFEGITADLVPYRIFANDIIKDKSDKYILNIVQGKYFLPDGDLSIKSNGAVLDEEKKLVILSKDVVFVLNDATLKCAQLSFNLDTQEAYTNTGVRVDFNQSNIRADSFKTEDANNIIEFQGNVKSSFDIKNE